MTLFLTSLHLNVRAIFPPGCLLFWMIRGACSRVLRLSYSKLKHANLKLRPGSLSSLLRQRPIHSVQSSASVHLIIKDSERRSHLNKIGDILLKIMFIGTIYASMKPSHYTKHSSNIIFLIIFFTLLFKNSCNSCPMALQNFLTLSLQIYMAYNEIQ